MACAYQQLLSKTTGEPGPGFVAWKGDLTQAHEQVFRFPWHRFPVPHAGAARATPYDLVTR